MNLYFENVFYISFLFHSFNFSNSIFWLSFFRYNPSLSKTYKMDIEHCSKSSMRHSIDCSDSDVVDTFKRMSERWPKFTKKDLDDRYDGNPHLEFLMAKTNFKFEDKIWFQKRAVEKNTLGRAVKNLIESTPGSISKLLFFSCSVLIFMDVYLVFHFHLTCFVDLLMFKFI